MSISSAELYYTPPSDRMFQEIKREAIKIWETYDNTYGYVDEKVGRIKNLKNVEDNYMYMVSMFDPMNQARLFMRLKPATYKRVMEAMR